MGTWKPIDTAPKDQRPVWARGHDYGDRDRDLHYGWVYFHPKKKCWWWADANSVKALHVTEWYSPNDSVAEGPPKTGKHWTDRHISCGPDQKWIACDEAGLEYGRYSSYDEARDALVVYSATVLPPTPPANEIAATHWAVLPDGGVLFYKVTDEVQLWLPRHKVWIAPGLVPYTLYSFGCTELSTTTQPEKQNADVPKETRCD